MYATIDASVLAPVLSNPHTRHALICPVQCREANAAPDDAAKLSSKVRSELPGKEKEATTQLKLSGEQAGKTMDSAVCRYHTPVTSLHSKQAG